MTEEQRAALVKWLAIKGENGVTFNDVDISAPLIRLASLLEVK